jgi:hypothetical protein
MLRPSVPHPFGCRACLTCVPPAALALRLQIRDEIAKYKVGAPARVGAQANEDVVIKSGGTGMDPSQTSFFQVRRRARSPLLKQAPAHAEGVADGRYAGRLGAPCAGP